jgi:hypothetical protein
VVVAVITDLLIFGRRRRERTTMAVMLLGEVSVVFVRRPCGCPALLRF